MTVCEEIYMIADTEMIWKQIPTSMNIRNMAKYAAF